jgi:hypothetical protein
MPRESFVFDRETNEMVPRQIFYARKPRPARSDLSAPLIMSDQISAGKSQLDGRIYDSRSALMQSYRDYEARTGKQVEVVGDQVHHLMKYADEPSPPDEKAIDAAITHALEKHDV